MLNKQKPLNIQFMVKIALLSAIAFVLTIDGIFRWRLPIFPSFLALDLSDIPALIGALTLGPVAGVWIMAMKNILDILITGTSSAGIGPLVNFLFGVSYILPMVYIYNRLNRTAVAFAVGSVAATIFATAFAAFLNYSLVIPAFAFLFGGMERVIGAGTATNEGINSVATLVLYAIVPFNILKNALISIGGFVVYKALGPAMMVLGRERKA